MTDSTENLLLQLEEKMMGRLSELENLHQEKISSLSEIEGLRQELDSTKRENQALKVEREKLEDRVKGIISLLETVNSPELPQAVNPGNMTRPVLVQA